MAESLDGRCLELAAILVTRRHANHGGMRAGAFGFAFHVPDIGTHTAGHIAYLSGARAGKPVVCGGDTIVCAGCGKLRTWENELR